MKDEVECGEDAAAESQMWLARAEEFQKAACILLRQGREVGAPARLCAMTAIELYLSAFLAHHGVAATGIRKMCHDLAARGAAAAAHGLVLRGRTAAHLAAMTEAQEYNALRYRPLVAGSLAPANRMAATLREVSEKVSTAIAGRSASLTGPARADETGQPAHHS